ncbi:hypothetical protein DFH28DRAFT_934647 [Melampsora americana]|nr:hypothetical protein DFH28DRAFT_934647 [Melampsora americana]
MGSDSGPGSPSTSQVDPAKCSGVYLRGILNANLSVEPFGTGFSKTSRVYTSQVYQPNRFQPGQNQATEHMKMSDNPRGRRRLLAHAQVDASEVYTCEVHGYRTGPESLHIIACHI